MSRLVAVLTAFLLVGCSAAADTDGEMLVPGPLPPAVPRSPEAVPVVVDSDLAPDDLAALAYLLRHPDVEVVGITVPRTGVVDCRAGGAELLGDLFVALRTDPVPVACGRTRRGRGGEAFPSLWGMGALYDSGLPRDVLEGPRPVPGSAVDFLAGATGRTQGLHLVALGPLTEPAALLAEHPDAYARLAGVTAMAGVLDAPSQDPERGVAEWNAAADPQALATVLAGPVPVTLVPADPVPLGPPPGMGAPVVGHLGVVSQAPTPAYWDLATAVVFTTPQAASVREGAWSVDVLDDRGRLSERGPGTARVVTSLHEDAVDTALRSAFSAP